MFQFPTACLIEPVASRFRQTGFSSTCPARRKIHVSALRQACTWLNIGIKAWLSGVLTYARRLGVRSTRIPCRGFHTQRQVDATNLCVQSPPDRADAGYPTGTGQDNRRNRRIYRHEADVKTIQLIWRHSDVSVTQRCYIKGLPSQVSAAMRQLERGL